MSICLAVRFAIAFFLIDPSNISGQLEGVLPENRKPLPLLWRADLRGSIGGAPLGIVVGRGRETQGKPHSSLVFLDGGTIAVTFVTQERVSARPELTKRDDLSSDLPLRLQAILLDASDGRIKDITSWPSESRYASIVSTHDGMFVTERGDVLTLYSKDLTELKRLQLPPTKDIGWQGYSSPTGRRLLFVPAGLATTSVAWIWVNADTLEVVRSWEGPRNGWVGIADNEIAMTTCVWDYSCQPSVVIKKPEAVWQTVSSLSKRDKPHPRFANENTLMLVGEQMRLVQTNGEVIFEKIGLGGGCGWGAAAQSQDERRLAVPSCKSKGKITALDIGGDEFIKKILVFDAPFQGLSYELDIDPLKAEGETLFAISPDGRRLAILNLETIRVFELPPVRQN